LGPKPSVGGGNNTQVGGTNTGGVPNGVCEGNLWEDASKGGGAVMRKEYKRNVQITKREV